MDYQTSAELPGNLFAEIPAVMDAEIDVPQILDVLPDGRDTVVSGDVDRFSEFGHQQGDNTLGYEQTCGLCSCEGILRQFGVDATEDQIVTYAAKNGLCDTEPFFPEMRGGTQLEDQAKILTDHGVPAHLESMDSLEDLAQNLEQGRGVIVAVNAESLWGVPGPGGQAANHAIVPIGTDRNPDTGEILGFRVNDTGTGECGKFVSAQTMERVWLDPANTGMGPGHNSVVTDLANIDRPALGDPGEKGTT